MNLDQLSLNELAEIVATTDDWAAAASAFERLVPMIQHRVRYRAAIKGWQFHDVDEFSSKVVSKLWADLRNGKFDPSIACFSTWFKRFVASRLIDEIRRQSRSRRSTLSTDLGSPDDVEGDFMESQPERASIDPSDHLRQKEPHAHSTLPQSDLDQVQSWQARDRVLVLAKVGWLSRVPVQVRMSWGIELGMDLKLESGQFPTEASEINDWLSSSLGWSPNALARRWMLKQELLVDLKSFWVVMHERWGRWPSGEQDVHLARDPWPRLVLLVAPRTWKRLEGPDTWRAVQRDLGKKFRVPVLKYDRLSSDAERLEQLNELAKTRLDPPPSLSATETWRRSISSDQPHRERGDS